MAALRNISDKVLEYKNELIKKAEHLIVHGFPDKIVKLNTLLETPQFAERNFKEVYQDLNIPVPDPVLISIIKKILSQKKNVSLKKILSLTKIHLSKKFLSLSKKFLSV